MVLTSKHISKEGRPVCQVVKTILMDLRKKLVFPIEMIKPARYCLVVHSRVKDPLQAYHTLGGSNGIGIWGKNILNMLSWQWSAKRLAEKPGFTLGGWLSGLYRPSSSAQPLRGAGATESHEGARRRSWENKFLIVGLKKGWQLVGHPEIQVFIAPLRWP